MIWSVLWARRWRALAVGALSAFVVAIAVSAPAYVDASERAMIRNEINHASPSEVSTSGSFAVTNGSSGTFQTNGVAAVSVPWLEHYFGTEINVIGVEGPPAGTKVAHLVPHLIYRQDQCAHVVIVSGRCPVSTREVLIGTDMAEKTGLRPGQPVSFSLAVNNPVNGWVPAGSPVTMAVVGVYHAKDINEKYWGSQRYFLAAPDVRGVTMPVLTAPGTIAAVPHDKGELQSIDSFLVPSKVTTDTIGPIRRALRSMLLADASAGTQYSSDIPALLDRMDRDRSSAVTVIALAVVPLLLLGCFVLFLVVAYGLQDRRTEVGVVRLRGVHLLQRWWLAIGEIAVPVIVGIPIGYGAAVVLTAIATTATVHGADTVVLGPLSREFLLYTLAGITVAIVAAHQRTLSAKVAELLRNVPTRSRVWRSTTVELALVAIAAAAVTQMHTQGGPLSGVSLLAPGLVIAAIAVLAGRFVPPIASRIGTRALGLRERGKAKRARLGLGFGALQLARRPGAQRVMTVHAFAIGLLAFTIGAAAFQASAQRDQVRIQIGAPRVLNVTPVNRLALVDAVRAIDPDGRFAMAVMRVPADVPSDPPLLAIDAPRLAEVANWPDGSLTAAAAAQALRPNSVPILKVTGTRFAIRADARNFNPNVNFRLRIQMVPLDGGDPMSIDMGDLIAGDATYESPTLDLCKAGCRVAGIGVSTGTPTGRGANVLIEGMRVLAPAPFDVDLQLSNSDLWQPSQPSSGSPGLVVAGSSGLAMTIVDFAPNELLGARPVASAMHIPVVSTVDLPHGQLGSADKYSIPVTIAKKTTALPRYGIRGALIDVSNYDAFSGADQSAFDPQVWLSDRAPADVVNQLRSHGIVVTDEIKSSTELAYVNLQGTAVGLRFDELAGVAALLLAIFTLVVMATIDRRSRAHELRVMRVQGFTARTTRRAAFVGHAGIVVIAGGVGIAAAFISWFLVRTKLPLFGSGPALMHLPAVPPWFSVVAPGAVASALLAATAAFAAADVSNAMRRIDDRGGSL